MKNYWKDTYGKRSEEFVEGVMAAIDAFAVWNDGKQYINGSERFLLEKEVLEGLMGDKWERKEKKWVRIIEHPHLLEKEK